MSSSRRSGRVAAQLLSKPTVSYKEVNSDDDTTAPEESNRTRGRRTAKAPSDSKQSSQNGNHVEQKQSDEQDDEVIVLDDDDADDTAAAVVKADDERQAVDEYEIGTPDEEDAEESTGKRTKRKRATATKQVKPHTKQAAQSKRNKQQGKDEEVELTEEASVEEEAEEEEEQQQAKPAKAKKRKLASGKGKKSRKAAAGGAGDPIAVNDDEEVDDKPKKAPKPKKEKQPSLLPHIRTVATAATHSRKLIGAHVGTAGGVHFGPHNAALMGARCFAMDTRSKRRWASAPYTSTVLESFHSHMKHYGYSGDVVLPHGSYLTNLGCLSDKLWIQSKACIKEELERCQQLGVTKYVFHPGRASTSGEEREEEIRQEKEKKKLARETAREKARDRKKRLKAGEQVSEDEGEEEETVSSHPAVDPSEYLFTASTPAAVRSYITSQPAIRIRSLARLITALNELLSPSGSATYPNVHILIETMAGTGNQLCSRFEELRYVIDALDNPSRIGVCIDTCHVFAADERYDMRQREGYERVMKEIEDILGWQYVKGMHMNDSKCGLGSHRDRHENIGDGEIGIDLFRAIMNDKRWDNLPIVLETPCKTQAKEAAKRLKKAMAAGEVAEAIHGAEEEEEDDEDDEDGEEGGKKGKGKGKGKMEKGPKEKEDWVKSYSEEIDMLYSLELPERDRQAVNGVKEEEAVQVKDEQKEFAKEEQEEELPAGKKREVVAVAMKTEVDVIGGDVIMKKEKQTIAFKRGRKGSKAKQEEADEQLVNGEDE